MHGAAQSRWEKNRKRGHGERWSSTVPVVQGLDPGGCPRRPVRILHPWAAGLPDLYGPPAGAEAGRRLAGPGPLHRQRHLQGPAGLPAQRAHGVRVGVRPRRLSRARLHRRLPAPRLRSRHALLRWAASDSAGAQDDRGLPHQPLRQADEDADADGARRPTPSAQLVSHYSRFFSDPKTEHGLRPERDHRPRRSCAS